MESDDAPRRLRRWPGWALLLLAAGVYLFTVRMAYPVPEAKYMGTQLMSPGATVTIDIATGVETPAGAHVVRDPKVIIEILDGSDWKPSPLQPVVVDTSGRPFGSTSETSEVERSSEVTASIRFTLPNDESLRGTSARLSVPLKVELPDEKAHKPTRPKPEPRTWSRTYRRKFDYATTDLESQIVTWTTRRRGLRWAALGLLIGGVLFWVVRKVRVRRARS